METLKRSEESIQRYEFVEVALPGSIRQLTICERVPRLSRFQSKATSRFFCSGNKLDGASEKLDGGEIILLS
jgi:hypothetical protein